ncbi:MAG: homocysteine S-methyltransferase family protein [Halioglobus sp.]
MNTQEHVYRCALPQLGSKMFLADGGLETTLIFEEDWELPHFAAFVLLDSPSGSATLRRYYERYIALALQYATGMILESPTWRASPNWGAATGYSDAELTTINQRAIAQLAKLRQTHATEKTPIVLSGCLGPEGDGYNPQRQLSVAQAREYHGLQTAAFADTEADMLCAVTFTYAAEAIGATLAARDADMPIAISFTVETDGHLPSGQSLEDAIAEVDIATKGRPAYYMVNCAHPTHFLSTLMPKGSWTRRIVGIRANASTLSHAELDEATELDAGDPQDFGRQYHTLRQLLPNLRILGGCCGTDHRHIEAAAQCALGTDLVA